MAVKMSRLGAIFMWAGLIVLAALFIFPFIMMVTGSFSETREIILRKNFWIPEYMYLGNYANFFGNSQAMAWVKNSFIYGIVPSSRGRSSTRWSATCLRRSGSGAATCCFSPFIAMMLVPAQVSLVPTYIMYTNWFDFINSYSAILVPGLWSIPYVFLMRQFSSTLPDSIIEAAQIDGAGDFRTFFRVVLPMLQTPIAVMSIFSFLAYWNLYMPVLIYMNDSKLYNLTVGVGTMVQLDGNYGMQMLARSSVWFRCFFSTSVAEVLHRGRQFERFEGIGVERCGSIGYFAHSRLQAVGGRADRTADRCVLAARAGNLLASCDFYDREAVIREVPQRPDSKLPFHNLYLPSTPGAFSVAMILQYGVAYAITGEEKYGLKAKAWLLAAVGWEESHHSFYSSSRLIHAVLAGVDWIRNLLSDGEIEQAYRFVRKLCLHT